MEAGHVSAQDALEAIEKWLLGDDADRREAASALLPVIPMELLFEVTSKLSVGDDKTRVRALERIVCLLFSQDPARTLQVLLGWAKSDRSKASQIVGAGLRSAALPPHETPGFYLGLSKGLVALRTLLKGSAPKVDENIRDLIKQARDLRSRAMEDRGSGGRTSRTRGRAASRKVPRDPRTGLQKRGRK